MIGIIVDEGGDELIDILNESAAALFDILSLSGEAAAELDFADADDMRRLNRESRGVDAVTDVLSFPFLTEIKTFDPAGYPFDYDPVTMAVTLGCIVICRQKASEQAREYGHSERREITYLFVHGLLHLLGYDHIAEDDKRSMRLIEEEVMTKIGVTR